MFCPRTTALTAALCLAAFGAVAQPVVTYSKAGAKFEDVRDNLKLAESQVYGAVIMGITWALFEECIYDRKTGKMLNADMEFYRLAGIKDIGTLKVHMMTGPDYDGRGVIGIGEPPAVSPGAAISNAVANACGVRVPYLPLTPDRVINALQQKGGIA